MPDQFCTFTLKLQSSLHLGRRRAGVVSQTHRHAPGHLFVYALAACVGSQRGGTHTEVFVQALDEIRQRFRFGPAVFMEGDRRLNEVEVEQKLLTSRHHVTLDSYTGSAVDSALFEVELLHDNPSIDMRLCGGVWLNGDEHIDGQPLHHWLSAIRLGGEQKIGCGRVQCMHWDAQATQYPGLGSATTSGLSLSAGAVLPGAALDGVEHAPLVPWLGRRYDPTQGFGRRLSEAVLVRLNGRVSEAATFLPANTEPGLGCWTRSSVER